MRNYLLKSAFKSVIGTEPDFGKAEDRTLMLCLVYLLQSAGVYTDKEYYFMWAKYGIVSMDLMRDIIDSKYLECKNVVLSAYAKKIISELKTLLFEIEHPNYKLVKWARCLCYVHYIRNRLIFNDNEVVERLEKAFPCFNDRTNNLRAFKAVKEYALFI